jgi:rhamnulokinase
VSAHLAIDLGAESGRAIVGVLNGDRLELHELHRFPTVSYRLPSGLHWGINELWSNVLEGTRKSLAWAREHSVELVSMGVDTWGIDFALLDANGELLGLPHCYRDERHEAAFEKTIADVGAEQLYEATGNQLLSINTLYQLVARRDDSPGLLEAADRLLFMPDLLHYWLTGEMVVESSIASTSQMVDPRTGAWATPLLERLGLPTKMLGPVSPPGTAIGATRDELDLWLQVIAPASHDTASAVAAVPADPLTSWCYLSSGTWSLMGAELHLPRISDEGREAPFTNEGGVRGTIRFLKIIAGLWLVQQCRRDFGADGEDLDYAELTRLAGEAPPLRTIIDPAHAPFGQPGGMLEKITAFAKASRQPVPDSPGAFVRCCLESLALAYRHTLEQLESVLERSFDVLHIVGGGGRNDLLNQMTADATGCRVVVGPFEATAAGNVLVQALGNGDVRDLAHLRSIAAASFSPTTIETDNMAPWNAAYDRYQALLGGSG